MKIWKVLAACFLLLFPTVTNAQFYVTGDNPASAKWYTIETAHFKINYPEGLDSLAVVYGQTLEKYRTVIGSSLGYMPGEYMRKKVTVNMHGYHAVSNGVVSWAPKRMDLFTSPSFNPSEAMTWEDALISHESRHMSQMQVGISRAFRPFNYIIGEMFNGLVSGVYSGSFLLEGDAVVAETALSQAGRGRSADFQNYYKIAFDNGDMRSLQRWRFGSYRYYTPNEYASGYLFYSGLRYVFDAGDILDEYYELVSRRPYAFTGLTKTIRRRTGYSQIGSFDVIIDSLATLWRAEIAARAPYTPYTEVSPVPENYVYHKYQYNQSAGGDIYSVKSSLILPTHLVRTEGEGEEKPLRSFTSSSSKLSYSPQTGRIYWSEYKYDPRWSLKSNSTIRYFELQAHKMRNLTRQGRLYSPAVSPDGKMLSVTEYYFNAATGITVLDATDGDRIAGMKAPDSLQVIETAWIGDKIYFTGLSEGGYGIYSIGCESGHFSGEVEVVLRPEPVMINDLKSREGDICFSCDRTGMKEFYHLDPSTGVLYQKTSTKYGADDFAYNEAGDTLFYSLKQWKGDYIVATATKDLFNRPVNLQERYSWAVADKLVEQEQEIYGNVPTLVDTVQFSQPKRYRKGTHLFKVHSWAPIYFNIDKIMSMSYDEYYELASLGVAALSQNELGTVITHFGYSAHKDPYNKSNWKHSGHATLTYTGWYPVIEASVDINDRNARKYTYVSYDYSGQNFLFEGLLDGVSSKPYIEGNFCIYIPWSWSKGGQSAGVIPQVNYQITNDWLRKGVLVAYASNGQGIYYDESVMLQKLTLSLRGYLMRPTASSGVYPRWGIGTQVGASFRPGLNNYYSPMAFWYLYGYVPGICSTQGLRITLTGTAKMKKSSCFGDDTVNTLPRGLSGDDDVENYAGLYADSSVKLSLDYGIPIYLGDKALSGYFMYLKRMVLTPHFDYTTYSWSSYTPFKGDLWSAGATLTFDFGCLCWLKFPFEVGITYSYSGGGAFNTLRSYTGMDHHYVGPVFSVSFN